MPRPVKKAPLQKNKLQKAPRKKQAKYGPQARIRAIEELELLGKKTTTRTQLEKSGNAGGAHNINTALFLLFCLLFGASCVLGYQLWQRQTAPAARDFMESCVRTTTPDKRLCGSLAAIRTHFNIDAADLIERRRALMATTAQRMAAGELRKPSHYQACIDRMECAPVPLLPTGVTAASVADSNAHLETREAFWQLAQGSPLTPQICRFIEICHALRHTGAITFP